MFVKLWMTENPHTITKGQTVAETESCLRENRIRRIPVVDESGQLIGIVSKQDIASVMPSIADGSESGSSSFLALDIKVEAIMTPNPMWTEPSTPLETVARRMRKHKIGGFPVLQDGKLVGIITESDIFAAFMEVLGAGGEGARIEMIIGKNSRSLYETLEIFKRYDMFIQAITVHHGFGENQQLLTIRVMGDELNEMLDALRKSGTQINRILCEDDEF